MLDDNTQKHRRPHPRGHPGQGLRPEGHRPLHSLSRRSSGRQGHDVCLVLGGDEAAAAVDAGAVQGLLTRPSEEY